MRPLGRSGLCLPIFTLGTANFGSRWGAGWTLSRDEAARILARAADLGVTALDTANAYNGGDSETLLGEVLSREGLRGRFFVSTKYGFRTDASAPDGGGSGAAAMARAVEHSLRRLRAEAIDLLYLHLWDGKTAIDDTLDAAAGLVRQGKIRAFGLSNVPAWYLARADALCPAAGLDGIAAVQLNYNLLMRHVEDEFEDVLGLTGSGLVAWGPLADGLLTGKYHIDTDGRRITGQGRLETAWQTTSPADPFHPRVTAIVGLLQDLASETGFAAGQIALAWMLHRPALSSIVIGVTGLDQMEQNAAAAGLALAPEVLDRLDTLSAVEARYPQTFLNPAIQVLVHGRAHLPERPSLFSSGKAAAAE